MTSFIVKFHDVKALNAQLFGEVLCKEYADIILNDVNSSLGWIISYRQYFTKLYHAPSPLPFQKLRF